MKYIVEGNLSEVYSIIFDGLHGDTIGSYNQDNEAALIVKDKYSWENNDQMSISIMLVKKGEQTEMVVVGSVTKDGWLVRSDGVNGSSYVTEIMNVLNDNNINLVKV